MKTLSKKAVKTALMLALPLSVIIVGFLFYNQTETNATAEDVIVYEDTNQLRIDSLRLARIQASIDKELDSIERYPTMSWPADFYTSLDSTTQQDSFSFWREPKDSFTQINKTDIRNKDTLRGPSALFARTYSLRIGKPVPVSVLWTSDSLFSPTKFELVTITLNDVADDKAGFTLADSSAVLLYSGANYAANDRISIEDENHSLHISVLQVQPDSVKIGFVSFLTDAIVSKLQESN